MCTILFTLLFAYYHFSRIDILILISVFYYLS